MNPTKPSVTAAVVAWARAANPQSSDPVTPWLIPRAYHRTLQATDARVIGERASTIARRALSGGLTDHMRLRTAAIDGVLRQSVGVGIRQVVLLGAGLDARAYRLAELADCTVFEVDHPASQAYKLRKVGGELHSESPAPAPQPLCAKLVHVAVDFSEERFDEKLREAGFKPQEPSFWVWEGVTMYLPAAVARASLEMIAELSCAGSRVAMTYMIPKHFGGGALSPWTRRIFAAIDEPLIGGMTPQTVRDTVRGAGFSLLSDGSNWEWAQQLGAHGAGWATLFRAERMAYLQRADVRDAALAGTADGA